MSTHFFVTGGTGLIGTDLLPRILQRYPGSVITLLVRGADDAEVARRRVAIAAQIEHQESIPDLHQRLRAVRGDVLLDRLGLHPQEFDRLVRETTHIIHGAATIRFDHPIDEARLINCGGTERILQIARQCVDDGKLERFVYIGTSSVSGQRAGNIYEHELEMGQTFFNTYEQSKCDSERIVRNHMNRIPTVIFRPSIVIGDSRTGRTSTFNVIYIPLRLLQRGMLSFIPGTPDAKLDLVPVDWVDDVMVHIMGLETAPGKVCHITAGPDRAAMLGTVVRLATEYFDAHTPLRDPRTVEYITREEFARRRAASRGREEALLSQLDTLLPYISINRLFNSATTDVLLQGSGITFPRFEDYAERIFEFCVRTNWGKAVIEQTS
jgi:thioester reductase-like protein